MVATGVSPLSGRLVEEPTTFLATAHQIELVEDVFGMTGRIIQAPVSGTPLVISPVIPLRRPRTSEPTLP